MRPLLAVVTASFAAFTAWVVLRTGYVGFFEQLLSTVAGWQVLADICIALFLVASWMRRDARQTGRRYWPYLALTVTLGSLGPLVYLVGRPRGRAVTPGSSCPSSASRSGGATAS